MAVPLQDSEGYTLPHDDPDILPEHFVIRHTVPNDLYEGRVSSGAYSESNDPHGGMSVDIEFLLIAAGLDVLHYVPENNGAVRLNVGELRGTGCQVGSDPRPENPQHGAVWGLKKGKRKAVAKIAIPLKRLIGENVPNEMG
jgi:hypothetical protein